MARDEIGADPRLTLLEADAADFLASCREGYDFVYADARPGKCSHWRLSLNLVKPGGIFLVDNMPPPAELARGPRCESSRTDRRAGRSAGFLRHETLMVHGTHLVGEAVSALGGAA